VYDLSILDCWKEMGKLIKELRECETLLPKLVIFSPPVNLDEPIKLQLVPKEPIKSFADYMSTFI